MKEGGFYPSQFYQGIIGFGTSYEFLFETFLEPTLRTIFPCEQHRTIFPCEQHRRDAVWTSNPHTRNILRSYITLYSVLSLTTCLSFCVAHSLIHARLFQRQQVHRMQIVTVANTNCNCWRCVTPLTSSVLVVCLSLKVSSCACVMCLCVRARVRV